MSTTEQPPAAIAATNAPAVTTDEVEPAVEKRQKVEGEVNEETVDTIKSPKSPEVPSKFKEHATAVDLQNFETFFKPDASSLLSKHLTQAIWDEYKGVSSDCGAVSFKQCIFSGISNQESSVGVYAGSSKNYTCFNKLFDPIITEYHGHGPEAKHTSDMKTDGITADFTEDEVKMVVSTRIRIARNLDGFPLGGGVTKEQRLEIMNKVKNACEALTAKDEQFKGKFYPLEEMKKEDQDALIKNHFLFKKGDKYLRDSNLNKDWPSGRGIFHNEKKTFLVWVNEEDQLRIISMQDGADIKQVFQRLCQASKIFEEFAKFSHNEHLGYITSCPSNLGTGLRASVHIKLPKLMKNKGKFDEIAEKYSVQIRGIDGEHSESKEGIFDISNKKRLGRSEKELVQDMILGVKALMVAEKSIE